MQGMKGTTTTTTTTTIITPSLHHSSIGPGSHGCSGAASTGNAWSRCFKGDVHVAGGDSGEGTRSSAAGVSWGGGHPWTSHQRLFDLFAEISETPKFWIGRLPFKRNMNKLDGHGDNNHVTINGDRVCKMFCIVFPTLDFLGICFWDIGWGSDPLKWDTSNPIQGNYKVEFSSPKITWKGQLHHQKHGVKWDLEFRWI